MHRIFSAIRRGLVAALTPPPEPAPMEYVPETYSNWEGSVSVSGWLYIITPENQSFELPLPPGSRLCLSAARRRASEMMAFES